MYLDDFNPSSLEMALLLKKKMRDLQVFTHRSSKLIKSLKIFEGNSLILLLCNHLLEKEENKKYFITATKCKLGLTGVLCKAYSSKLQIKIRANERMGATNK